MNKTDSGSSFRQGIHSGRTAYIAGGSGGINFEIGQEFFRQGANVVLTGRDQARIDYAARSLDETGQKCIGLVADVRDYDAVSNSFEIATRRFGPLDIVVSGAAGNFMCPAKDMSANAFKTVVEIDLIGTFNVFRASYDRLRKERSSLIAISAPQSVQPFRNQVHACAAKAGVNLLVKTLALEWGRDNIRVNAISPGFIAGTEGVDRIAGQASEHENLYDSIALRAFGTRSDISALAAFLCTQEAQYITGAVINCDGGLMFDPLTAAPNAPQRS